MNQGTARVVIIVALVVVGAAVLANGFSDTGASANGPSASATTGPPPTGSGSASPTSSVTATPTPKPQKTGLTVMALNGTNVTGAGAAAQETLLAAGYVEVESAADAPSKGVQRTVVYFRPGDDAAQAKSNAAFIAETYFPGAKVAKLDASFNDIVPASVDYVVVVGEDYASQLVGA